MNKVLLIVRNIFENGSQNHLIFQSVFNYFKTHANDDIVMAWKSKSLSDVSVKSSCYIRK